MQKGIFPPRRILGNVKFIRAFWMASFWWRSSFELRRKKGGTCINYRRFFSKYPIIDNWNVYSYPGHPIRLQFGQLFHCIISEVRILIDSHLLKVEMWSLKNNYNFDTRFGKRASDPDLVSKCPDFRFIHKAIFTVCCWPWYWNRFNSSGPFIIRVEVLK